MHMWMVEPHSLCRKHLLGEHSELHKFLPSFRKGVKVDGRFYPMVQIQFQGYLERHDAIASEMIERGYNHKSPLIDIPDFKLIYPQYYDLLVDKHQSYEILCERCEECRERILMARYKYKNKTKVQIGNIVKIVDVGRTYTTFEKMAKFFKMENYDYGNLPQKYSQTEDLHIYRIIDIGDHIDHVGMAHCPKLAGIKDLITGKEYIINVEGLEVIQEDFLKKEDFNI